MEVKREFCEAMEELLGAREAEQLVSAIVGSEPVTSVRLNGGKPLDGGLAFELGARVPWCDLGYYLDSRAQFTFDPLFHAGAYYVQDASSMFISHVLRELVDRPVRYLDLCAAPGGKTTAAIDALPCGSLVVANEVVPSRARVLADNVMKWGSPNTVVTQSQPREIGKLRSYFDVVAADVPCSGEGMMRKDSEAASQWSRGLVAECASRQREILAAIWPSLKAGGLLIYSTCTYNTAENEDIVAWLQSEYGAEAVAVPTAAEWGISGALKGTAPCYRFMPHKTRGEGLTMAVLRKPGASEPTVNVKHKPTKASIPAAVKTWLRGNYEYVCRNDTLVALPSENAGDMSMLMSSLHCLTAGIELCTMKGMKPVPSHALALSRALCPSSFATVAVDYESAIAYLRGSAITLAPTPRGYMMLSYGGKPLGFVNNLGTRANNMYPKALRILSQRSV